MTQDEFWDAFRNQDIVVRTNTREQVQSFYAAASAHGLLVGSTDYDPGDYPWSIYYHTAVTGWTGHGITKAEKAEHMNFEDWAAIEDNDSGSDIPCVSLEGVL